MATPASKTMVSNGIVWDRLSAGSNPPNSSLYQLTSEGLYGAAGYSIPDSTFVAPMLPAIGVTNKSDEDGPSYSLDKHDVRMAAEGVAKDTLQKVQDVIKESPTVSVALDRIQEIHQALDRDIAREEAAKKEEEKNSGCCIQ